MVVGGFCDVLYLLERSPTTDGFQIGSNRRRLGCLRWRRERCRASIRITAAYVASAMVVMVEWEEGQERGEVKDGEWGPRQSIEMVTVYL
jgi:hypothetical protein